MAANVNENINIDMKYINANIRLVEVLMAARLQSAQRQNFLSTEQVFICLLLS